MFYKNPRKTLIPVSDYNKYYKEKIILF